MNEQELASIDVTKVLQNSFDQKFSPKQESEKTLRLKEQFKLIRDQWTNDLKEHANSFGNLKNLSDRQVRLYSDRQRLVESIFSFQEKIERVSRQLKEWRKYYYKIYEKDKIKSYTQLTLLIDSDVSELEERLNLMSGHGNFLTESLKTMDFMLYAVKQRISLEEYN